MQINGIFSLASQQASWLSVRQKAIAENIAQANVPGYVAKDTEPFKALVGRGPGGLVQTDARHLSARNDNGGVKVGQAKAGANAQGDKVNVETELMKSIEVRNGYEINTAIVKAFHRMILAASKA